MVSWKQDLKFWDFAWVPHNGSFTCKDNVLSSGLCLGSSSICVGAVGSSDPVV